MYYVFRVSGHSLIVFPKLHGFFSDDVEGLSYIKSIKNLCIYRVSIKSLDNLKNLGSSKLGISNLFCCPYPLFWFGFFLDPFNI